MTLSDKFKETMSYSYAWVYENAPDVVGENFKELFEYAKIMEEINKSQARLIQINEELLRVKDEKNQIMKERLDKTDSIIKRMKSFIDKVEGGIKNDFS